MIVNYCPFCGGNAYLAHDNFILTHASYIKCGTCGAEGEKVVVSAEYSADEKAATLWNRRTSYEEASKMHNAEG